MDSNPITHHEQTSRLDEQAAGLDLTALPSKPAALLFDCDGTLANTENLWRHIITDRLRPYVHTAEEVAALGKRMLGVTAEAVSLVMTEYIDLPADRIAAELLGEFNYRLSTGVDPMPGAPAFVAAAAGLPLAVASNSRREELALTLGGAGLADAFTAVVGVDEVPEGKPAPDLYAEAASRLGVPAPRCVVIEDSPVGCAAARGAGAYVVGVNAGDVHLDCDVRVSSLEDSDLLSWVQKAAA